MNIEKVSQFLEGLDTLKEISKTGDGRFAAISEILAVNFDKVKEKYYRGLLNAGAFSLPMQRGIRSTDLPKSADCLYFSTDEDINLIEFKISKRECKSNALRQKALESLLALMDILQKDREFARNNITFIVVYGEQIESALDEAIEGIFDIADMTQIDFNLERYKGLYFKEILTMDADKFAKYIEKEGWINMNM
ncbi:MAG: hypothetical protein FWF78_08165 [Defluviitaleaceae bacterium]|nr:hypothetical protein [Defluviitaleaceae bacterium]